MNRPYPEATVELVAKTLFDAEYRTCEEPSWEGLAEYDRDSYRKVVRIQLDALAKAGLLLPAGVETRTEYGLTHADRDSVAPYKSREQAELWQGYSKPGWELVERTAWYTPWRAPSATCCEMHGTNCEPPSELCCEGCSEAAHDSFPIRHADGSTCVMDAVRLAEGENKDPDLDSVPVEETTQ